MKKRKTVVVYMYKKADKSLDSMIKAIKTGAMDFEYQKLKGDIFGADAIRLLYNAYKSGDARVKDGSSVYLLYKDVSDSKPGKFLEEAKKFFDDKNAIVATVYTLEGYESKLKSLHRLGDLSEEKAVGSLVATLENARKIAIDSLQRSIVVRLTEKEMEVFKRYIKNED